MVISQKDVNQLFKDLSAKYKGDKEAYFALLYLQRKFGQQYREMALQVDFRGNDLGVDAFHYDPSSRILYLFQFIWSDNHNAFKPSMEQLIQAGMERIFSLDRDEKEKGLIGHLREVLFRYRSSVDKVNVLFVFNGDP